MFSVSLIQAFSESRPATGIQNTGLNLKERVKLPNQSK